jgi:hypothetical protein
MTRTPAPTAATIDAPTQALLDLIEADRARQCAQIIGDENSRAAALRAQACREARGRLRQAFEELRRQRQAAIAAAQARLATRRRLRLQQRHTALLQLAWQQLPRELKARWQQADARAAWVAQVLSAARTRMPQGPWRILHAPDWPIAEQQALAAAHAGTGPAPILEADANIIAGLKVVAQGNVIDGTLEGLLADRTELDARLLRQWEATP